MNHPYRIKDIQMMSKTLGLISGSLIIKRDAPN